MSVIIRDLKMNKIILLCKGADSIIMKRLSPENSKELNKAIKRDLLAFSKEVNTKCYFWNALPYLLGTSHIMYS